MRTLDKIYIYIYIYVFIISSHSKKKQSRFGADPTLPQLGPVLLRLPQKKYSTCVGWGSDFPAQNTTSSICWEPVGNVADRFRGTVLHQRHEALAPLIHAAGQHLEALRQLLRGARSKAGAPELRDRI